MKKIVGVLVTGLLFLAVIAAWYGSIGGENILSFLGIFHLICGVMGFANFNAVVSKMSLEWDTFWKTYYIFELPLRILTAFICAAYGWYWIAAGFFISGMLAVSLVHDMNSRGVR